MSIDYINLIILFFYVKYFVIYIFLSNIIILVIFMGSCELVTLISSLACIISKDKTIEELNFLAVLFTQLGDTLATIAVNNEKIENCKSNNNFNIIEN